MQDKEYALVVDNSPVIRKIVSSVIEKQGWHVRTAVNGLEALDIINEKKPAIIFTDLIMPKIDGEKLTYIIRNTKELKDIFLVILSGVAMEDNENTMRLGANICIAKGPAAQMSKHILRALDIYSSGEAPPIASNDISGMEGLYPREVTRELLVSKRHQDIVLDSMTEGVVELNHTGRVVLANRAAVSLFNMTEAKVLGIKLYEIIKGEAREEVAQWLSDLTPSNTEKKLVYSYENPVLIEDRQVIMSLVPVADEEEMIVIGMLKDITERVILEKKKRQLEKELQRVQKIDAMSVMASGIAHDFNNLLTIINGNIEMCRYLEKDSRKTGLLEEAGKALTLTNQLIRKITTFSDNYLPQREETDLEELIEQTLQHTLAESSVSFTVKDSREATDIKVDTDLVGQVITNLASNSLDAIEGIGEILVSIDSVTGEEEARKNSQPLPPGQLIRIIFEDNGNGIEPEIIDQVFDPYFSTKKRGSQKGMGLGLTIVHSIVKKHGGMVWVDSTPGSGCRVYLYLAAAKPVFVGDHSLADATERADVSELKRVLFMDDDEMMRMINKKMFEQCKCDVSVAANGSEALDLFFEAEQNNRSFDLILLDLFIDGEAVGLEVSGKILKNKPDQKIIAISGDAVHEVILNYEHYGFISALTKPFSLDAVMDIVKHFLEDK